MISAVVTWIYVVKTYQTVHEDLCNLLDINYTLSKQVNDQMPLPQPWQLRVSSLGWGPGTSAFSASTTDSIDLQPGVGTPDSNR